MTAPARIEPQLEFFEEQHEYQLDGIRIPSVTTILSWGSDLSRIPAWTSARGTAFHLATEYDDAGDLDESSVDPLVKPHLDAYRKWKAKNWHLRYVGTEQRVWGEIDGLRFAGTIDRVVDDSAHGYLGVVLLDLKSGAPRKEHGAQLQAYSVAYQQQRADVAVSGLRGIYCAKDGTFTERSYDGREHLEHFRVKLARYYEETSR
jgi:hypothetical protein